MIVDLNPNPPGLFEVQSPPLVSQMWDPKNSKTQFFQTDMVLNFHLSS